MFFEIVASVAFLSAGLGTLTGLVVFATILVSLIRNKSNTVTPSDYQNRLRTQPGAATKPGADDPAWPWYIYKQAKADISWVYRLRAGFVLAIFKRTGLFLFRAETVGWWLLVVPPVLLIPFNLMLAIAAILCNLAFVVMSGLTIVAAWTVFALTVGAMRGFEWIWQRSHRTGASCPQCYYVSPRPAYECNDCGQLHRDIRPGLLGVVQRRCDCDHVMPTMVLRAAWNSTAVCQRCGEELRKGASALRDVRLPIFGDVAAGKTRFMFATLDSMILTGRKTGFDVSFPDDESHERADAALLTIRSNRDTAKTDADLPRAFTFRLGNGTGATLVHLFDAAGERYRSADSHDDLGYLDAAHSLVYVVDPFTLGVVQAQSAGLSVARKPLADAAGKDPASTYDEVVSRLRGGGVKANKQRLAVVVTKADVLAQCGIELPLNDHDLKSWLFENGLHNLTIAADNEFADVRYFAAASIAAKSVEPELDSGRPVRWLLRAQGVKLPEDAELSPHLKEPAT